MTQPHVPKQKPARRRASTTSFLLEIGSEELPWQVIQPAMRQLACLMEGFLTDHRLSHAGIRTCGTPRRLAVIVTGLATTQSSILREVLGPSTAVALNDHGQPTRAAEGFARSQGVDVAQLETRETSKGTYLCAVKREEGMPVASVFAGHLAGLLGQLAFPKTMRWNASGVRYPRPIRWLVAMLGTKPFPLEFAGVQSGPRSRGHRFWSGRNDAEGRGMRIARPEAYEDTLERAGVIVDPVRRRDILTRQLTRLAGLAEGQVPPDNREALLEQAVFSLEWPNMLQGTFETRYLELPPDVLMTSMQEHQGFFPVVNRRHELLPLFFAPTNMDADNMELVRVGSERVLAARLADARYFFHEDRKQTLADRVPQLHGVVFHKQLGSLYQKTERMIALAGALATDTGVPELKEACQRAAFLSKADLVTGMVGEFPTLQGVMGGLYATHDGESGQVCAALGEYYRPRTPDDALPVTMVGRLLALADRVDTLAAFFYAGIVPSGSEDPYGLRRHAFGLIRIASASGFHLNVGTYLRQMEQMLARQGVEAVPLPQGETAEHRTSLWPLFGFLEDRLRYYGRLVSGYREDVMTSVLARHNSTELDIRDLLSRMDALQAVTIRQEFDALMVGFKRAHRIVVKEAWESDDVTVALLTHPTERGLHQAVDSATHSVKHALETRDYHGALRHLMVLKGPIDHFFDDVLVNAPESDIRANRLSLLRRVDDLFASFGDLSHIQVQGQTSDR